MERIDTGFINHERLNQQIEGANAPTSSELSDILTKAREMKGIDLMEVLTLLNVEDLQDLEQIFQTADEIKHQIYGKRMVLFAPLYISNVCYNEGLYCGFRKSNCDIKRKTLTMDEIERDTKALINDGHKRILLVSGEGDRESALQFTCRAIEKIYATSTEKGNIRRINVNIAPPDVEGFKLLKERGIGTYQLFQETYDHKTYRRMHPSGKKSNYLHHLTAMDRAMQGGIDDVGLGVLFGLHDPKFEVLALMTHIQHLEKNYGVGCHTISVPRIEPADNSPLSLNPPFPVDDLSFKKIIAILRIAVPYTGIILSTRENQKIRREAIKLGISQISAGSKTDPGGYSNGMSASQFSLGDHRSLGEVIDDLLEMGYIPSFCTGCYRKNRTGADFMDLAKPGLIQHYCFQNGLTSFQEYLSNFADKNLFQKGQTVIAEKAGQLPASQREALLQNLELIKQGQKDIYI